jgi:16S rRNA (guanine527-N7)-methyltransferase
MESLDARLSERAAIAGIALEDRLRSTLLTYYQLLLRWNTKVNLTALTNSDDAIDRLLLEPVAAAQYLPRGSRLMDLGSGGGSPAIPLALALQSPRLVMVESRGRKAAFLREAARAVGLQASVENQRFETVAASGTYSSGFDVVSMRAVRMDLDALTTAARFLTPAGVIGLFVTPATTVILPTGLKLASRAPLLPNAELITVTNDVPRGT